MEGIAEDPAPHCVVVDFDPQYVRYGALVWMLNPGREYLVYLESRGSVSLTLTGGPYKVEWVNAQDPNDIRPMGTTTTGTGLASPADGDDWLLHLKL